MEPVIVVLIILYCLYWLKLIVRLVKARSKGDKFFNSTSNSVWFGVFVVAHIVTGVVFTVGWVLKHIMWVAG